MTAWTNSTEVKKYALVKWGNLNYETNPPMPFGSEAAFDTFLTDTLIPRAQGHINAFCQRDFDVDYPTGVPEAVKDVTARAAANMLQYLVMNKMGPLIQVGDYKISIPQQAVLPDDLRALLAPWVRRTGHVKATAYKTRELDETWEWPEKDPFLL